MTRFVARRLAFLPLVMFAVTALLFAALQFLSPERRAALYVKDPRQLDALDEVIRRYGLDQPVHRQYARWMGGVLRGDLGWSETAKMPVADAIRAFFPATLELALAAFVPTLLLGIGLGTLSALRKDRLLDHLTRVAAITGYSLPAFVLGLVLLMIFYGRLGWFPPGRCSDSVLLLAGSQALRPYTGLLTLDAALNGQWAACADLARHLVLPAATLTFVTMATLVRITRSSVLEELGKDYVRTARAKGLSPGEVVRGHVLRNALVPVVTMSSLLLAGLLGGVVITETVFNYPGMGRWAVAAAQQLDIPSVLGAALLASVLFVLANTAADLLYALVDPRIRMG